jgi:hypothetical protein
MDFTKINNIVFYMLYRDIIKLLKYYVIFLRLKSIIILSLLEMMQLRKFRIFVQRV